jgi:hypothetical protein
MVSGLASKLHARVEWVRRPEAELLLALNRRELDMVIGDLTGICARSLPWVDRAAVRLREHGHAITGDIIVVPRADAKLSAEDLAARVEAGAQDFCNEDWRLPDLTVMPVLHLKEETPPRL